MNTGKKKILSIFLNLLLFYLGIVFSMLILISAVQHYSFRPSYFKEQFEKNQISAATGFSSEQLDAIINRMTGYLSDREDNFNLSLEIDGKQTLVFNDRELAHMLDVKVIYILLQRLKQIGIGLLAFFLLPYSLYLYFTCRGHRNAKTVWRIRRYWINIFKTLAYNGIFTLVLIGGLVFMLVSDFSKYFIHFHEIFFDNDLWLLNPETDRLIQMLPEKFFFDISSQIILSYALVSISLAIIASILYFVFKKEETGI